MSKIIRIGTRDSELALWQAKIVQSLLENLGHKTLLVPVKSTGDLVLDKPLYELGITGIFTRTLDIAMLNGDIDVILEIPQYFERDLTKDKYTNLSVTINAIDGAAAGVESVYINQIIQSYNKQIKLKLMQSNDAQITPLNITTIPSFWYNKTLNYKTFMVPGILVLLVTMITLFLSF